MTEVAGGEGLGPRHTSGVAEVIVDESRGSHKPAVITTTATGASIDLSEVISNSLQSQHVSQTLLGSRKDFHTHPRSLALAHLQLADWRTHEKLRTAGALLAVCLNLGTDPPDLVRPKDRARLEAWVDPDAPMQVPTPEELALEAANNAGAQRNVARERTPMKAIGESLQRQFEHINRHAKYRQLLDCSMEDLRKQCMGFRRAAKEERLLFYYNGHGVPRPTTGGDIWVFNKQFTQYIPVSAMDLMSWIGTPCVYVWDCAHAMNIVHAFEKNAKIRDFEISRIRHAAEAAGIKLPVGKSGPETMAMVSANISALLASQTQTGAMPNPQTSQQQTSQTQQQHQYGPVNPALINLAVLPPTHHEDIHFAASQLGELLPTNPELPADLFTSCLTTPIKAALRFWVIRNPRTSKVTLDLCDKLPGSVQDRRTPFGELNWIFTSISDTIAWSTLPRDLFHKLFRQDVVVASLFRNFMLADRMMRFYNVHPQSRPAIPSTHKHPLWDSLDLEIDMCLQQLPRLLKEESRRKQREDRANRVKQERVARASARRGPHRQSPLHGIGPMDFGGQQRIVLEIADTFRPARGRRGRAVLGGIQESDDDDVISGNDSDGVDMGSELGLNVAVTGYISSTYFSNQLYAFEVWLQHAATEVSQFVSDNGPDQIPRSLSTEPPPNLDPPDELPAVLQVLLSQQYRLRALILLYRFMNLGPWAVNLAMAVGIFPYMSKLLASTTAEIREILILVWARLIAVDMALHAELMKNDGMEYFVAYLANNIQMQYEPVSEKVRLCDTVSAASAFTLTMLCKDMPEVQQACFNERVLDYFLVYLQRPDNGTEERSCLRTWILMCLGELWRTFPNAKWMAMTYRLCVIASKKQQHEERGRHSGAGEQAGTPSFEELLASSADDDSVDACDAQDLLVQMAFHRTPVVRAAAVYAMGTLIEDLSLLGDDPGVLTIVHKAERQVYALLLQAATDGSPIVRREVVCIIGSAVFASYMPQAIEAVARVVSEELREQRRPPQPPQQQGDAASEAVQDLMVKLYKVLLKLSVDGHPDVALVARETCDVLMQCYAHSRMFFASESSLDQAIHRLEISRSANGQQPILGFIRSAGTGIGDALLGYPPLSHSELPASPTSGMNRQLQQQQQARRMPQTRSRNSMVGQRGRDMSGQQNGSVPAHHRYTMHFAQGSVPRQSLFGQQTPPTPRSPSAAGSISAASLANLDLQSPHSQHQNTEAARARDRFAGMDDAERAETMLKFGEVEQAWLEWGRHEL
ncbi:Target of rapamycin complex 1 subunit kog1, partial [Coemansia erecta]